MEDFVNAELAGEKLPKNSIVLSFDDGYIDHYNFVLPVLKKNKIKFDLENIKTTNFAKSYAKTLETWYENFQIAWSDIEEMGFDAKFKRTWDMYLAYCRGGFLNGQLEVSQYLLKIK